MKLFIQCLFLFLLSGSANMLFAQDGVITVRSGNLTLTMPEKVHEIMEERATANKEEEIPRPEFCQGVRVQVFYGKDRDEADRILGEVKTMYPEQHSNMEYDSPDYKIKVGFFDSAESARPFLSTAKKDFPLSLPVTEIIRCGLLDQTTR